MAKSSSNSLQGLCPLTPKYAKEATPMAQNRTRSRQIIVRMTDHEYVKYERRLQKSKLNGNSFCIKCLLDHQVNVIENMAELIRLLKMAGNNLNQLARAVNSGYVVPGEVNELSEGVDGIWQWLKSAVGEGR